MADSNITKNALAVSMKKLMEKKPFSKISVGDICEDCGMNRKSFYYHFKDKYDLVNWIFDTEITKIFSELAARADGHKVTTLEGLQDEAAEFGAFIADQGAEQCGFCNPGFIMNALALFREKEYPTDEEIKEYLSGNLCRCSGYEGQLRGIQNFLAWKKAKKEAAE